MTNPLEVMHVTSPYGLRQHPITKLFNKYHNGVDLRAYYTDTYAVAKGIVVTTKEWPPGIGKYLIIDHGTFTAIYGHLSEFKVKVGDVVTEGVVVAKTGNSGASTAPHLHFEIREGKPYRVWTKGKDGRYTNSVDPIKFLKPDDHWAEGSYNFLTKKIAIHEKRFDENITRGEVFALLARLEGYKGD